MLTNVNILKNMPASAILSQWTRIIWIQRVLGKRLREERKRLGLTQTELAEAGGVRRVTVYLYEKGDRTPTLEFLDRLKSHGVSFEYVLWGERRLVESSRQVIDAALASELYRLVDRYAVDSKGRSLHVDSRAELFDALVFMASNLEVDQVDRSAIQEVLEAFAA